MPNPDFSFDDTFTPEDKIELQSLQEQLQKLNQTNFKDINFGAIRPGAGSVIEGDLIVDGTIGANKIVTNSLTATQIDTSSISVGDWGGSLDNIDDGSTYKRALQTELTGGSRAYNGLNTSSEIIKGYLNTQLATKDIPTGFNGVRIDSNGLYGFKNGSATFSIDTGGDATFSGDIISSTVTSSTVTGSTLTTATSGSRVEIGTGVNQRVDFYIGSSFIGGIQSDNVSASNFITFFGGSNNHLNLNSGVYAEDATLRGSSTVGIRAGTEIRSFANFVPGSDSEYDLGTSSKNWKRLYVDGVIRSPGTLFFYINDSIRFQIQTNAILSRQEIRPFGTLSLNLGSSTRRWETVYCVTLNESSSKALKKNIKDEPYGLEDVMKLKPRIFEWKKKRTEGPQKQLGLLKEELEQVIPEAVSETGYYPSQITSVLIKAIQELNSKLEAKNVL